MREKYKKLKVQVFDSYTLNKNIDYLCKTKENQIFIFSYVITSPNTLQLFLNEYYTYILNYNTLIKKYLIIKYHLNKTNDIFFYFSN